jgi:uncharacterized protein (DUF433 family)
MQLEDYFEFEKLDSKFGPVENVRIKGHRIAIDRVIGYFNDGIPPERIQREKYPALSLEVIYATITYYLHNKVEIDAYLERGEKVAEAHYQEHLQREPDEVAKRIRTLKAKPQASNGTADGDFTLPV